jgi:hypothetical protein
VCEREREREIERREGVMKEAMKGGRKFKERTTFGGILRKEGFFYGSKQAA